MRALFTICILLLTASFADAQTRNKSNRGTRDGGISPAERLYFGGGGGFGFGRDAYSGNRYSYFSISPLVGVNITESLSAGPIGYYQSYRYPDQGVSLSQYGGGGFAKFRIKQLFAWAEYNIVSVPNFDQTIRRTFSRAPLGIGFQPNGGGRSAVNLMALYDVTYNRATSPFGSPWIFRVFVVFGGI